MIRMREGAWLPSQKRGMVWADEPVVSAVDEEITNARAEARVEVIDDVLNALSRVVVETEVGACVPWREVLRLLQR